MKILKRNQVILSVLALMLITVGYMSFNPNMTNTLETGALMDAEKVAGIGDAKLVNSNNTVQQEGDNKKSEEVQNSKVSSEGKNNNSSNDDKISKTETAESAVNSNTEKTTSTTSASSTSTSKEASTKKDNVTDVNKTEKNTETKETASSASGTDYFVTSKMERDKMFSQMVETYQKLLEGGSISAEQKNISTQEIANINNQKNAIMIAENLIKNLGFENVVIFVNYNSTSVIVKASKLEESDVAQIQNIVCREIGVDVETIHISTKL